MTIQYDARSLLPDFSDSLKMALGVAHEVKDEREVAGLENQLDANKKKAAENAGGTPVAQVDFLMRDENQKILRRMARINPQAAQTVLALAKTADMSTLEKTKGEAEEASRVFSAFLDTKDPADRNRFLAEQIRQREEAGKDTSKLRALIGRKPEEQTLEARRQLILAGDVGLLADNGMAAMLEALKVQGQQLSNAQTAQQMQLAQAEERRKAAEATGKAQETAQQKQVQQQSLVSQSSRINSLIDEAINLSAEASTGLTGTLASTVNPTGKTAQLERVLGTLKANVGFDKLLELKAQGGNLGALSKSELEGLQSVIGNLDYRQDKDQLVPTLERLRNAYSQVSIGAGGPPLFSQQAEDERKRAVNAALQKYGAAGGGY